MSTTKDDILQEPLPESDTGDFPIGWTVKKVTTVYKWDSDRKEHVHFEATHPEVYPKALSSYALDKLSNDCRSAEKRVGATTKVHGLACCPKAFVVFCVCRISFQCPDHGSNCHGTHD